MSISSGQHAHLSETDRAKVFQEHPAEYDREPGFVYGRNPPTQPSLADRDSGAKKQRCLDAAAAAVCGDRALNYGRPEKNFDRIAVMWNAWQRIQPKDGPAGLFTSADIAAMMILMKLARLANNIEHADSWIDIAGYAACGYDITVKEEVGQK